MDNFHRARPFSTLHNGQVSSPSSSHQPRHQRQQTDWWSWGKNLVHCVTKKIGLSGGLEVNIEKPITQYQQDDEHIVWETNTQMILFSGLDWCVLTCSPKLVNCPTIWSLLFIFGFLCWPKYQRDRVQQCTSPQHNFIGKLVANLFFPIWELLPLWPRRPQLNQMLTDLNSTN